MKIRRRFSAEFKARVALEAIRRDASIAELAERYDLHPNLISQWRRQAINRLPMVFGARLSRIPDVHDEPDEPDAKRRARTKPH